MGLDPEEQDKHIPDTYEGKIESNYYCRAWNEKRNKYCGSRAGKGTEHKGVGRCNIHDGRPPEHGKYSKHLDVYKKNNMTPVERWRQLPTTIQDIYDGQKADPDPLSVEEDINIARSVLLDYIQRYEEARKKLDAWYQWYQREFDGPPPKVKLLPVEHVITFLKKITDIAHKEKKLKLQDAISIGDFYKLMGKMGKIVERWVTEPDMEPEEKLKRIKDGWQEINL